MPPVRYESLTVVVGFMLNSLRLGKWYSHTCGSDVPAFTVLSIKTNGSDVPVNGSDVPMVAMYQSCTR